ncbi:MAG TPA: DNA primase, partial [Methylibium sp.]
RATWLLLHRCESWDGLSAEVQALLAEQPAPYGAAFALIERQLHEHGPLGFDALAAELERNDPSVAGLATRVAQLHGLSPEIDVAAELRIVADRLQLQSVEEELQLLFESGALSEEASRRGKELIQRRAQLKSQAGAAGS